MARHLSPGIHQHGTDLSAINSKCHNMLQLWKRENPSTQVSALLQPVSLYLLYILISTSRSASHHGPTHYQSFCLILSCLLGALHVFPG